MAIRSINIGNYLTRTGAFTPTTSWTWMQWLYFPPGVTFVTARNFGDGTTFSNPYIGVFGDVSGFWLETWDGSTDQQTTRWAIPSNAWIFSAVVYDSVAHTATIYQGTSLAPVAVVGTLSVDLSTFVFVETDEISAGDPVAPTYDVSSEYDRVFQRALTGAELDAERGAITAASSTNLVSDTRIAAVDTLTDSSGNGHTWTATGTLGYRAGPLPPPNLTPTTALVIGSLPYTLTEDVQDAPTGSGYAASCSMSQANAVWFLYVAQVAQTVLGVDAQSDMSGNYTPTLSIWTGTPPALTQIRDACVTSGPPNSQIQFNATPGTTYYVQVSNFALTALNSPLTLIGAVGPATTAPAGSLLILNDSTGYPAAVLNASDGAIVRMLALPAAEQADTLPDGSLCIAVEDPSGATFAAVSVNVYDNNLTLIGSTTALTPPGDSNLAPVRSDGAHTFYVANSNQGLGTITDAGVVTPNAWTLPSNANGISCGTPNRAGSMYYYGSRVFNPAVVHAFDLLTSSAAADLYTGGSRSFLGSDLAVLATGDILIMIRPTDSTFDWNVLRVSPAGSVVATYDIGLSDQSDPRLALGLDDPLTFWTMTFDSVAHTSRLQQFDVTSGATLVDYTVTYTGPGDGNRLFGPSQSCPLLLLRAAATTLGIAKTHGQRFLAGMPGAFMLLVRNQSSSVPTSGVVTVTEVVPAGMSLVTMDGDGWTCVGDTCTRSDALAPLASYPPIVVVVDVAPDASSPLVNAATVTASGETASASDSVTVGITQTYVMRRRRIFQFPFLSNLRLFLDRLEFVCQPGVGLGGGPDDELFPGKIPALLFRLSTDGGQTWGPQIQMGLGEVGQYGYRTYLNNLGSGRNLVGEVATTDPVPVYLLDCLASITQGYA